MNQDMIYIIQMILFIKIYVPLLHQIMGQISYYPIGKLIFLKIFPYANMVASIKDMIIIMKKLNVNAM